MGNEGHGREFDHAIGAVWVGFAGHGRYEGRFVLCPTHARRVPVVRRCVSRRALVALSLGRRLREGGRSCLAAGGVEGANGLSGVSRACAQERELAGVCRAVAYVGIRQMWWPAPSCGRDGTGCAAGVRVRRGWDGGEFWRRRGWGGAGWVVVGAPSVRDARRATSDGRRWPRGRRDCRPLPHR